MDLSQNEIHDLFRYDEEGFLRWRKKIARKINLGDIAGSPNKGHVRIYVRGKNYYAARLIWIYHNGQVPDDKKVRHLSVNTADNRIGNLYLETL